MSREPIRLAFPLIGRGLWTGGFVYLKNTLRLIRTRLAREIEASVFLSPSENQKCGAELAPLVDGRVIVEEAIGDSGRGRSLTRALLTGRDSALERLLKATRAQAVFEVGQFYGARFGLPVISWIPDLQHRFMPEMFSRVNWWRRDLAFRMQIFSGRTLMVSSQTAHDDMERCYPRARGRGHVVRFAIDLDIAATLAGGGRARAAHGLPDRFLLLPNQFWRHKNHIVIVQALVRLKSDGALPATLPVVLSGSSLDVRSPGHFEDLMGTVRAAGVESHFRYLGLIPYEDVLSLAGCCDALINPSYFEGWSTTIEEAKALGAPLMLSDIPIHREQAPQASFFAPGSSDAAAQILRQVSEQASPRRPLLTELLAAQARRLDEHARSLLAVVAAAANRGAR